MSLLSFALPRLPVTDLDPRLLLAVIVAEVTVLALSERRLSASYVARVPLLGYLFVAPGTVLHELAHALMSFLLGVRVFRVVSFWPTRLPDGSTRFGYVLHADVDGVRNTLIAIAPVLLVPPMLAGFTYLLLGTILPADLAAAIHAAGTIRVLAWVGLVGLGSRAAYPSPGDRVGGFGKIFLAGLIAALVYVAWTAGGPAFATGVLVWIALGLAIPTIVDAGLLALDAVF